MDLFILIVLGFFSGLIIKQIINWLAIDNFIIRSKNIILEILNSLAWMWSFSNLDYGESILFVLLFAVLSGLAIIDMYTFQIPIIFIFLGIIFSLTAIYFDVLSLNNALWGIFVGAVIPFGIMGSLWLITKRQGMGYGDLHLGLLLGTWLGPMRMAITLFCASALSLIVWVLTSFFKGFDRDRAMPMAPYLSVSAIGIYIGSFYYPEIFHLLVLK